MKRVNRKEYMRLEALARSLSEHFHNPAKQSQTIWRGDYRAIQWAARWIREQIEAAQGEPAERRE